MTDIKKNTVLFSVDHVTYCITWDGIRTSYSGEILHVKYYLFLRSASRQISYALNITFEPNR
jgi:hypothetical protein